MTGPTPTTGGERAPVGSSTHLGLQVGSDSSARCYTYPDAGPILVLDAGRTHLTLTAAGRTLTADHVGFAHALV